MLNYSSRDSNYNIMEIARMPKIFVVVESKQNSGQNLERKNFQRF